MAENFDINLNDEVENFEVEFGEIQRITVDDFDKLRNRPSYAGQTMTHETNIPVVPNKVSQLENDSDYQTGADVAEAIAGKQDTLTAGSNIQISEQNVISATDTVYSGGNGINISAQNAISVDTTIVATQQSLSNEVTNRENADIYLQGQIDAISASSDVVDIVGTYAELQAYDTTKLKDNDIIKVLQDETQGNATTYYRWSTSTQTFTLIGQEGPYYTKAGADAQFVPQTRTVNGKALSANITLNASDVSALGTSDVAQTTGSSTSMVMSQKATTDVLGTKLNITDYVVDTALADSTNPVQNKVLNNLLGDMPSDFFSGDAEATETGTEVEMGDILAVKEYRLDGDTTQQTYSGKNLMNYAIYDADVGRIMNMPNLVLPVGTFTMSFNLDSFTLGTASNAGLFLYLIDENNHSTFSDGSGSKTIMTIDSSTQLGRYSFSFETNAITHHNGSNICIAASTYDNGARCKLSNIQIEPGSTATNYEPYCGGVPAPNPDYPQTVNVVTGVQTVTVSDGGSNTQTFTIDLGATELCKLGNYQDYIYKSGGDWYMHKETGKVILDGSNDEGWIATGDRVRNNSIYGLLYNSGSTYNYYSNQLRNANSERTENSFNVGGSAIFVKATTKTTTVSNWITWLSSNNLIIYGALATPTDTKITDATLISELEALLNASTYDGKTDFMVTATGTNLPAPLQLTAINANAKGLIERMRA